MYLDKQYDNIWEKEIKTCSMSNKYATGSCVVRVWNQTVFLLRSVLHCYVAPDHLRTCATSIVLVTPAAFQCILLQMSIDKALFKNYSH